MSEEPVVAAYGTVVAPSTLTIQRKLPGPIERIWAYLTDSDLRRQWFAAGVFPEATGAEFELVWRNDELAGSEAGRPDGFAAEHGMKSELLVCEPPHRLAFSWPPRGEVAIELKSLGSHVLLTLTHQRISDRRNMVMIGAGWHMHLDILVALATDTGPEPFWMGWSRLKDEYERLMPA
ncbi:SRPBCC family protein [Rhizobium sp. B230/85]|uniref:SRPBCC family protein n=1 Tax=unclassified Rhizobium TaxID=2613769 RepID=UPI001AD9AA46|nr:MULTISPECIES: SRPBCC family protein [unclassified Rhizobium]MBO9136548.1 SRPBCC family protein [Rhizobium sp. B209b/85]QXZ98538.1 SRPBCC family protein [Rhizobium sp. B230/85]